MSKELIDKIFKRLPAAERIMPAVVLDDKSYTWEEVWLEVRDNKPLAEKMQKKIEEYKGVEK